MTGIAERTGRFPSSHLVKVPCWPFLVIRVRLRIWDLNHDDGLRVYVEFVG